MGEPPALAFEAGQWISVPFGPKIVRAYSIASSPRTADVITLCADVAPGGVGSTWFRALAPGHDVRFKGPLGGFVLEPADARRLVFVAEEIGIVPIRAMLGELALTGFSRPASLVYWARDPSWLVYGDELAALARRHGAFAYHPVVRQGASGAAARGEAADVVDRVVDDISDRVAYVAGGETTIKAVRATLVAKGLERRAVKWERFW
jgi:ferredoxin-NADP reductase